MELSRTVSAENARTGPSHLLAGTGNASAASRKGRASEETSDAKAVRASISMPPPASKAVPRQFPSRRPSKASDVSLRETLTDRQPSPAIDDSTDLLTPTSEAVRTLTHSDRRPEIEPTSNRLSFSSLYSIGSGIYPSTHRMSGPASISGSDEGHNGTTTATSSLNVMTASQNGGSLNPRVSPTQLLFPAEHPTYPGGNSNRLSIASNPSNSPADASPPPTSTSSPHNHERRARSRTQAQRRISGSTAASSSPGGRDMGREPRRPTRGIIGVCALESKARSKPARNIFGKLVDDFEVKIFGDKIILDEDVENWPVCDFLISFFSDGFPLDKAIAYARLRKPFCVNDLPMQQILWDRRLCLLILDQLKVPTPRRVEVSRDGGPRLASAEFAKQLEQRTGVVLGGSDGTGGDVAPPQKIELIDNGDTICVDGMTLTKPFVEKPVSGEDHNIHIYYHSKDGGGGRRLFRKVNNKSSEKDDSLYMPRSMTEPESSYIYEQFLQVENAEDVKAYTVGPNFCHAETRKSPVVDGLVKRNPSGKEVRYVTNLTEAETAMAARISNGFGQRVCGFDLLRAGDRSYVIDVNGWSFVKDNQTYYEKASTILKELFLEEIQRRERKSTQAAAAEAQEAPLASSAQRKSIGGHRSTLKELFKSPSMSKLAGHHPHLPHMGRSGTVPNSPDTSLGATPIAASPSFEKADATPITTSPAPAALKSEPDLLLPPSIRDTDLHLEIEKSHSEEQVNVPPPASKAQWKLKGVVSVVRHADRTPKQKFKYTFHTKPFVDLLKGHQEEVLLIGEAALQSVSEAVKLAMKEGEEDPKKLRELQVYLDKKGAWPGTKVQIKPMFRKRRKEERLPGETAEESPERTRAGSTASDIVDLAAKRSDSTSGLTLSRISAAENNLILEKLQLIIKWGGEPTHSARHQTQDMGANFRNDLLLMNRDVLDDVHFFSSSERRVTTSAQIFAASFLERDQFAAENIHVRKDLLDDSNAAKDIMDKVKKKLKTLLRAGDKAPPQFAWPKDVAEPYIVAQQVVELMKFHQRVMNYNFKKLETEAVSSLHAVAGNPGEATSPGGSAPGADVNKIQPRWCCNEGPELFKERWEKLFKEFKDADKVDPSKISELYDTMKFDALHNRQFLEWIFTPDSVFLDEETVDNSRQVSIDSGSRPPVPAPFDPAKAEQKEAQSEKPTERGNLAHRMGFRRKSEVAIKNAQPPPPPSYVHESYFKLYTGVGSTSKESKAQTDARLVKLREMYHLSKVLFDYIGPQEYGIDNEEKLEIGLLTSLPLLKEIVEDLEELQASDTPKCFFYFTKESHIYTLLNCILEGGIKTKIERNAIPELDYLSQIGFELYESENTSTDDSPNTFNYSIRITLSPGCHAFAPLDVQLDSRHMIGFSPRRSLTAHHDWKEVLETLRAKFHTVKLPKSFVAINLSEKVPDAFGEQNVSEDDGNDNKAKYDETGLLAERL
ncbi:inositol hexakisphosphate and diphosphoinositol-pentakisphosphate kinase [Didymosphaeria variabile]|uniref:Inositol hexakisphosphate and diphosphoinositol-pentakisphosphate kinase n=1 Tax=Didymosphaeria variabile TaxID=1932322 RepID=A0A9W8XFC6_9PLEO|nr:inositol hexakisphosphate and diphosphoinositol-pentakisphosphate kinase [Didymosphaeria variabile]KAJ4349616.1 inositol hexakisphosphate and diphosphoinositol-pentakisphosphate kinase [Didymosphaeria variabile]